MKKLAALFLILAVLFSLASCTNPENESSEKESESSSLSGNGSPENPDEGNDNSIDIGDLTDGI